MAARNEFRIGDKVFVHNVSGNGTETRIGTIVAIESGDRSWVHPGSDGYRIDFTDGQQGLYFAGDFRIIPHTFSPMLADDSVEFILDD